MFKTKILTTLFVFFTTLSFAQSRLPGASGSNGGGEGSAVDFNRETQLKKDIDEMGLTVASELMNCCSTWGGSSLYANVDFAGVRKNLTTETFTIPMTVGWYGSVSQTHYWIRGKLVIQSNGARSWIKLGDSQNFLSKSNCGKNCIN